MTAPARDEGASFAWQERVRLAFCCALFLLGLAVMAGWLLRVEALKSVVPGLSTMKFNTALAFVAVGIGLAASHYRRARGAASLLGGLTLLIGILTVGEFLLGTDFGIDQLVVADDGTLRGSGHPGRMSLLTASAWVTLGPAIILLAWSRRRWTIILAHGLGGYAGFVSFLAAAGYTFGAEAFWGIGLYTVIAVHTAAGLLIASAAVLMTRSGDGWLEPFVDSPDARALLARTLPLSILVPALLGFLILLGSGMGAYNAAYGFALFIPATGLAMVLVSLHVAGRVRVGELALRESRADLEASRQALQALNSDLEQRIAAEVAERSKAEEALRQSQKLESIGQLTGGVAHDFNNLLTPIIGGLDILQRNQVGDDRSQRMIAGALQSAERARHLVQRLLAFARRQPLQPGPVDLAVLVGNMAELIVSTVGPRIALSVDIDPALPPVLADPNQLEMAILNLCVNARDAMSDGGSLAIAASKRAGTDGPAGLAPGNYVSLSVSDSGAGMEEAVLARAIEPFFSTKGVGHGTGLGLSMVHGLMAQLGGSMALASEPGLGTCVTLWLPEAQTDTSERPSVGGAKTAASAGGTALLVDDEKLVRASVREMLSELGYTVLEADSGSEALAMVEAGRRIDLLVTDHLMPGMTGTELARKFRALRPGIRIVIISGYADVEAIAPDFPRLSKPFRQEELAALLAGDAGGA